ncbi:MAG: molybdopterin-dependent oxidoreductase [Deltaproteobacteria bacterium]|nr:molybdopterin-dependent oxidoreductase [Deltaproteobacteria bacterium]
MKDTLIHTYCAHSKSRCGVICEVEDGVLKSVRLDPAHPNGGICVKGTAAPQFAYHPDRLKYPMKRTRPKGDPDPGWVRISWDEALETVTRRLLEIRERDGAEAVVFDRGAPGGSAANDYVGWLTRLANVYGSPNCQATTHTCNWHKDTGSKYTYGVGIPAPDFEHAACILIWGHNPEVSWHSHAKSIGEARRRGARLVVIDPRRINLADKADLWLEVRPGTDGALALAFIHVLLGEELYDREFVRAWTNAPLLVRGDTGDLLKAGDWETGGDESSFVVWDEVSRRPVPYHPSSLSYGREGVVPALLGALPVRLTGGRPIECRPVFQRLFDLVRDYSPEAVEQICWVDAERIRQAARLVATNRPACYYTYVGLEEHTNAMQTNRAVCVFYALTGNFDAQGGNALFPTTPTNPIGGKEFLPDEQVQRRLGYSERPLGPVGTVGNIQAYDFYRAVLTGKPYPIRALVAFGGNILLSNGDTRTGIEALKRLEFLLHVDIFPNPCMNFADIVLPASTCWEAEHVKTSFEMGPETSTFAQLRKAVIPPLYESRPDMEIIFELAVRLGHGDKFFGGDIEAAFNHQLAPSRLTVQDLREHPVGIAIPLPVRYRKYAEINPTTGRPKGFHTPTRRMEIFSQTFKDHGHDPLPVYREPAFSPANRPALAERFPFVLTTSKLVQYCHTQHRNIPMLRRQMPHPFVEIHPQTAKSLGIENGEWVALETLWGSVRLKARITDRIHPRVVSTQHGWWEGCEELGLPGYDPFSEQGANVNLIISNEEIDPISGSVPHRSSLCALRKLC